MSNYPPTPSFGGPFNFGAHWAPPLPSNAQTALPALPPKNVQPPDAQIHHQQQLNSIIPPPSFPPLTHQDLQGYFNTNASSFTTNAQFREYFKEYPPVPPPHFPYPPSFGSTSFPHPPFPPIPLPIPGLPSGLHQQNSAPPKNLTPPTTQHTNALPQPEQSERPAAEILSAGSASVGDPSVEEDADKEDGELSEEDFVIPEVHSPGSGRVSPAMGQTLAKVRADNNGDLPTQDPHEHNNINTNPQDLHRSNNSEHPRSFPAPGQPTTLQRPSQSFTDQPSRDSISIEDQATSQQHSMATDPTQLKKQATGALFNLLPHNIKYDDLIREGVDPGVLRRLYADIGVKVATSSPPLNLNPELSSRSTMESTESSASQTIASVQTNASMPTVLSASLAQDREDLMAKGPKAAPAVGQSDVQEAQIVFPMKDSDPSRMLVSKGADVKQPPRNEYIARMLAAKTGKTAASSIEQPEASAVLSVTNLPAPSPHPAPTAVEESDESRAAGDTKAKEKIKAQQTELARQRMEQLREQVRLSKITPQQAPVDEPSASAARPSIPPMLSKAGQQAAFAGPIPQSRGSPIAVGSTISEAFVRSSPQSSLAGVSDFSRPNIPQIPGLFMTEPQQPSPIAHAPASLTHSAFQTLSVHQTPSRNRPVASDFIDQSPHLPARPFGQTRDSQVVIDISDEEIDYSQDESDVGMDTDVNLEKTDEPSSSREAAKNQAIRDLLPLTDFPGRQPFSVPSNPMTPPIASARQTPGKGKDFDDLQQKNQQIEEMKRKIMEMESRRKLKQQSSRTPQTPGTPSVQQPQLTDTPVPPEVRQSETTPIAPATDALAILTPPFAAKVKENTQQQCEIPVTLLDDPDAIQLAAELEQSSREQDESSATLLDLPHTPQQLARTESRMTPIELTGISSSPAPWPALLNAQELELKRKRKAEIESGLPMLDAEVERTRSKLEEMRREMQKMEDDIKRGLEGRASLVQELEALGIDTEGIPTNELQAKMDQIVEEQHIAQSTSADSAHAKSSLIEQSDVFQGGAVALANDGSVDDPEIDTSHQLHSPKQQLDVIYVLSSDSGPEDGELDSNGVSLQEEQQAEPEMYSDGDDSAMSLDDSILDESPALDAESPVVENESSTAHNSMQPMPIQDADSRVTSRQSSPSELGETKNKEVTDSGHEPDVSESIDESDGDFYEPPEPVPTTRGAEATESPPFSPAPPGMSISEPSISNSASGVRVLNEGQEPPRASSAFEQDFRRFPTQVNQSGHFTPYESPLRQFHTYRFHPEYTSNVEGGYASTTYSNRIDPKNPVCVYESSGGICNDSSCDSQHFRQMHLSGDMILAQLGGIREGKTSEERQQYIDGLKTIIADMRRNKVKDLDTIADEIAKYRRQFLQDPSRILAL